MRASARSKSDNKIAGVEKLRDKREDQNGTLQFLVVLQATVGHLLISGLHGKLYLCIVEANVSVYTSNLIYGITCISSSSFCIPMSLTLW